ncbi:hypothetical protein [Streptacidiphilus sp. EB103A]|uniref:hypothetical protein n=1 Tax=Streptacidiphilus sp. EB103A TaxID=3156275 RepID=UPI003510EE02
MSTAVSVGHGWAAMVATAVVAVLTVLVTVTGKEATKGFFSWLGSPQRTFRWTLRKGHAQQLTAEQLVALMQVALEQEALRCGADRRADEVTAGAAESAEESADQVTAAPDRQGAG